MHKPADVWMQVTLSSASGVMKKVPPYQAVAAAQPMPRATLDNLFGKKKMEAILFSFANLHSVHLELLAIKQLLRKVTVSVFLER